MTFISEKTKFCLIWTLSSANIFKKQHFLHIERKFDEVLKTVFYSFLLKTENFEVLKDQKIAIFYKA